MEYTHNDHLTGTSVTTDSDGEKLATVGFYPFGSTRCSSGELNTDKLFTGQRLDQTGLYFYNARYYDAEIGRFISADTIVPDWTNPQSLNRYSYCLNNPLKYVDSSGHDFNSIEETADHFGITVEQAQQNLANMHLFYAAIAGDKAYTNWLSENRGCWYTDSQNLLDLRDDPRAYGIKNYYLNDMKKQAWKQGFSGFMEWKENPLYSIFGEYNGLDVRWPNYEIDIATQYSMIGTFEKDRAGLEWSFRRPGALIFYVTEAETSDLYAYDFLTVDVGANEAAWTVESVGVRYVPLSIDKEKNRQEWEVFTFFEDAYDTFAEGISWSP